MGWRQKRATEQSPHTIPTHIESSRGVTPHSLFEGFQGGGHCVTPRWFTVSQGLCTQLDVDPSLSAGETEVLATHLAISQGLHCSQKLARGSPTCFTEGETEAQGGIRAPPGCLSWGVSLGGVWTESCQPASSGAPTPHLRERAGTRLQVTRAWSRLCVPTRPGSIKG